MTLLFNPRVWLALAIVATSGYTAHRLNAWGESRYEAGYEAHRAKANDRAAAVRAEIEKLEAAQRDKTNTLQAELHAARQRSEALAQRIRHARFECSNLGAGFVELYNEASAAH